MNNQLEEQQTHTVTLTDYLRILYRGRWLILFSFIIVFTATVYYTFTTEPVYESTTSIFIDKSSELSLKTFPALGYDRSNAEDMESSSWVEAAKDRLGEGKLLFVKELRTDRVLKPL